MMSFPPLLWPQFEAGFIVRRPVGGVYSVDLRVRVLTVSPGVALYNRQHIGEPGWQTRPVVPAGLAAYI